MADLIVEVGSERPAGWDEDVSRSGCVFQTSQWAEYWNAYFHATPHYITVRSGEHVAGVLLALEMPMAAESLLAGRSSVAARLLAPVLRAFSWREGPVVLDPSRAEEIVSSCLDAVSKRARERRTLGVQAGFQPLSASPLPAAVFARHGFVRRDRVATVRLDLRQPLDAIWNRLKQGVVRTPIRKAQSQGVTLTQVTTRPDLERYYRLVSAWRTENGLRPYPYAKFALMRERMPDTAVFFVAECEGQPVAGAGLWYFAGQAHLFTPVQSAFARERRIYGGDFLIWEMIRWCHERGFRVFDLSGISRGGGEKDAGIRRFKEKWGGRVVEYDEYELPLRSWQRSLVEGARRAWHGAVA